MTPADHRAARREFIRAHHPDAGGDPTAFISGLQRWDEPGSAGQTGRTATARVRIIARRAWPMRIVMVVLGQIVRHGRPPRVQ